MMSRQRWWSIFPLLLSLNSAAGLNFSTLLYSLKLCSEPGTFCPEPNCANGSTHYLCQWYDCTSKSSSSSCLFFGSQSSCGGDSECLENCSRLHDGSCPACISAYKKGQCQDSVLYTGTLQTSNTTSSTQSNNTTNSTGFSFPSHVSTLAGLLVFLLGTGALAVVLRRKKKPTESPLEEKLTYADEEGLVKRRMNAVEAGYASDFVTPESRTQFKPTDPSRLLS